MTKESAAHSLFYILAVTLLDGEMTLRQYAVDRFGDPRVLALIDKMSDIHEVQVYNEAYMRHEFPLAVQAHMGGETMESVFVRIPKGHPLNPLSDEELTEKFYGAAGTLPPPMYEGQGLENLLLNLWRIENWENIVDAFEDSSVFQGGGEEGGDA